MSKLFDFLHPIADKEEKEVIISKRFVKRDNDGNVILDEDGKAVLKPFRIRAVSQEENEAIAKSATRTHKDRSGQTVRDFDKVRYSRSWWLPQPWNPISDPLKCARRLALWTLWKFPARCCTPENIRNWLTPLRNCPASVKIWRRPQKTDQRGRSGSGDTGGVLLLCQPGLAPFKICGSSISGTGADCGIYPQRDQQSSKTQ